MAKSDYGKSAKAGWSRVYEQAWDKLYNNGISPPTYSQYLIHIFHSVHQLPLLVRQDPCIINEDTSNKVG